MRQKVKNNDIYLLCKKIELLTQQNLDLKQDILIILEIQIEMQKLMQFMEISIF